MQGPASGDMRQVAGGAEGCRRKGPHGPYLEVSAACRGCRGTTAPHASWTVMNYRELWLDTVPKQLVSAPGQFQWAQQHGVYLKEADFRSNIVYRLDCVPLREMEVIAVSTCECDLI